MSRKAYFLIPSIDYAPDELIKPGQIISSLKTPYIPRGEPLIPPQVHSMVLENWEDERGRSISGSVGIWAKFLSLFGLGGDLNGNIEREDNQLWRFQRLETYFFVPTEAYVKTSMQVPEVRKFFEENPKTPAYMITGVKIARGASLVRTKRGALGADAKVGVHATGFGVPISIGPKASINQETIESESFTRSSDFVFAYRLIKIYKHPKTGAFTSKEKVKGALYGHGWPVDEYSEDGEKGGMEVGAQEFEIEGFGKEDIGLSSLPPSFERTSVRDDGEDGRTCEVIWLKDGDA